MMRQTLRAILPPALIGSLWVALLGGAATAQFDQLKQSPIVQKIRSASERQEMTVNSSRILTLDEKIPQAQVNNPEILELTPLSPTQIQIFAKKPGVTQVNLWDEKKRVYTVDVIVFGDARELSTLLETQFPNASIQVIPVSNGVLISGYVDQPEHVGRIVQIAEEYYPKVINNITIGGVQQVLLHVKVMEVSRTKLRALGFDWTQISGQNVIVSGVSGLVNAVAPGIGASDHETFSFSVINGSNAFFGVLEALREDRLAKILAEPNIVAVSGRPSKFHVGGEFTVVPQGLAAAQPMQIQYGTTVDFVAIVLGNGRIHLEVRPEVSELDRTVTVDGVPGLRTRTVDTGVEMQAGQTLAIAGLVQNRVEAHRRGLPWVSEVPYLGMMFRRVHEENNEVELLITVTPELVDAMDAHEVPPCGPGLETGSPNDWQLYARGHIEVPVCRPPCGAVGRPAGAMPGQEPAGPGMILEEPEVAPSPSPANPPRQPSRPAPMEPLTVAPGRRISTVRSIVPTNRHKPSHRQTRLTASPSGTKGHLPGFMGAIGYDVAE